MQNKTVFVGISGGVDSSVALYRLKQAGYNVVGVFIKVWHPDFLTCNWEEERLDAMRVAAHLDVPFLTCDAEAEYKRDVADYFIAEYTKGRTPNPDVMCNSKVKFGAFLRFALERGADYIATGHYVNKVKVEDEKVEVGEYKLLRGNDTNKDQSYFLWTLTQHELTYTLFPVGDTPKEMIRAEAKQARVPVADKKDSQGICFLGHIDIPSFLSHYTELTEGQLYNTDGTVIGHHGGALVYTLGQRHGFTINEHNTERTPYYVVARDLAANTVTVDVKPPTISKSDTITLEDTNWIATQAAVGAVIEAQIRYRQKPFEVIVESIDEEATVLRPTTVIDKPSRGQSCVLYEGKQCLGGGIIL